MFFQNNEYESFKNFQITKSLEINNNRLIHAQPSKKTDFSGLTLMQYIKMDNSNEDLQEIDEESNSSLSVGTPYFAEKAQKSKQKTLIKVSKIDRREKNRIQRQQELFPSTKLTHKYTMEKIATIKLIQTNHFTKDIIKLPFIHEQRHINNSRAGLIKDEKEFIKKQNQKTKNKQTNQQIASSLHKQNQKTKIRQFQRNDLIIKNSIRAKFTSTSFYQAYPKDKERARIKTQQQSSNKFLESPFLGAKYQDLIRNNKAKKQAHQNFLKKYQNTFKHLKKNG